MKGERIPYTAEELAWIEARAQGPRPETHAAFCALFGRKDVALVNFNALCKRRGWLTGRTGRYEPGRESETKGTRRPFNANSAATQFKKGERRGVAARLYKPIGTERLSKSGYVERKIHDGMPLQSRWRAVHLIRWEEINGPVPAEMCLKCLGGDKANTDPANWEMIPRGMLPRLNGIRGRGYDTAAPELKPTIMAITKLEHAARTARQGEEDA